MQVCMQEMWEARVEIFVQETKPKLDPKVCKKCNKEQLNEVLKKSSKELVKKVCKKNARN